MKCYSNVMGSSISMSTDPTLREALAALVQVASLRVVLECGTFEGTGSTRLLAEIFEGISKPDRFVTIEANWRSWRRARANLRPFAFVEPVWGCSLRRADACAFIRSDEALLSHERYPDVFIDHVEDPVWFYLREIEGRLGGGQRNPLYWLPKLIDYVCCYRGEGLLEKYLAEFRCRCPLILLDSSGGTGWLEFMQVERIMDAEPYVLLLDDIQHVKHFRSYQKIQSDSSYHMVAQNVAAGWALATRHFS